jgi:hypothetical protein
MDIAELERERIRLVVKVDQYGTRLQYLEESNNELVAQLHQSQDRERVLREAIKKAVSMFISTEISGSGSGNFVDEFEQGVCGLLEEALKQEGKA